MRKTITLFSGLLLTLGLTAAVPGSAHATEPEYFGPWQCQAYRDISTCLSLDWARQADGTGVRLEGIQVRTERGCGSLEDDGGKYNPVTGRAVNNQTGSLDYTYDFGEEPCAFYKDVSNAVGDNGGAVITVEVKARIDSAGDKRVGWRILLGAGGSHTLLEDWVEDV
jgi:hypothetical protein